MMTGFIARITKAKTQALALAQRLKGRGINTLEMLTTVLLSAVRLLLYSALNIVSGEFYPSEVRLVR